jgi:hypothetical protein
MMFFCKHSLTEVDDKGYQYCVKCNKAFRVSEKHKHNFVVTDNIVKYESSRSTMPCGYLKVYMCSCGKVKRVKS